MSVRGCITVSVSYRQQQKLSMLVVQEEGPILLERDWLNWLQLDWNGLHQIRKNYNQPAATAGSGRPRQSLQGGARFDEGHQSLFAGSP